MIIIGLTGGIATGKSTTADLFLERGIVVFDADRCVHQLLGVAGLAVAKVVEVFGDDIVGADGAVDRKVLGNRVFQNAADRRKVEKILHPLVAKKRDEFLSLHREAGAQILVLDVPLLFEVGTHELCDLIVVTTVAPDIQRERALAREGMTGDKLNGILKSQMPLTKKLERADLILDTGTDLNTTRQKLFSWLDQILSQKFICSKVTD